MAERFILPLADVGAGIKPFDGAKLFFSESGLPFDTDPKNTYSDKTATTPNANPVVADANGLFGEIYLVGAYRAVLKDKNNVQIWEADNVTDFIGGDAWVLFSGAPTQTSATTFTLVGDQTSTLTVGTRLKFDDSSTLYGIVTASVFTTLTTVTVSLDSGSLSGSLSAVYTGLSTTIDKAIGSATVSHLQSDIGSIYDLENILYSVPVAPQLFGAVMDGASDDSAAIQSAINTGLHVRFGKGTYRINSTLKLDFNKSLQFSGVSRRFSVIEGASDDLFDVGDSNDATFFHFSELYIKSEVGGGHCFNMNFAGGNSMWKIENCKLENKNTGKSIWNQVVSYSGGGIVENCHLVAAVGATVHPWFVQSSEVINGWAFKDIRADNSNGTKQFFYIDTTSASSFVTNISFQNITFELTNGGMICAKGAKHILIENVGAYDLNAAQTGHGILIDQGAGGLNSQRVTLRNIQKSTTVGYSLSAGIQDIKLANTQAFLMDNVDSNTGATLIDYGNAKGVHFNTPSAPTYLNDSFVLKCIGDQIDLPGEITARSFKHETSNIEWDVGSGSPEGVETAEPGSIYSRSVPSGFQALYVKLSGSGNTGWNLTPCMEFRASSQIQDATDSVNTSGKGEGRVIFDTTLQKILFATGSGATATWKNFNGTVEHTPS